MEREDTRRDTGHGGTDLGRRIREQRHQAGLSLQQTADAAGVAGTYLAYVETDPDASPTPATLARLAEALGTTSRVLSGAGLDLPPGQQRPRTRPATEIMTPAECRAYLGTGGVGRFVYDGSSGPVAVPVNYRMAGDDIVFRTSATAGLTATSSGGRVSFEVDHIDDALAEGWSVLASGRAHLVTDPAELREVRALGIRPWPGDELERFMRVVADEMTGRRIRER